MATFDNFFGGTTMPTAMPGTGGVAFPQSTPTNSFWSQFGPIQAYGGGAAAPATKSLSGYDQAAAALQAGSPVMQSGGSWQDGMWVPTQTASPNSYMLDPNNPDAGFVQRGSDGSLVTYVPAGDQGVQYTTYGPNGQVGESGYQKGQSWQQGALTGLGVLGGAALLGNLPALLAGGAAGGGAAAAGSPLAAGVDPVLLAEVGGAGSYGATGAGAAAGAAGAAGAGAAGAGAAGAAGGLGSALGGVGSALGSAGGLLSNPALWAAGGAALGLAGRGDITSSQTAQGTSSQTGSSTGTNSGTSTQGLAPWLQPYAQQAVGNMAALANGPQSNASLDTTRGLLTNLATNGDPTVNAGAAQQRNVIGGAYLNSNPYIDQVAGNIGRRMGDAYAIGSRAGQMGAASQSGNWDSAGASQALGLSDRNFADSLGSTMSNLYYGNYNNERARQDAASVGAINFGNFGLNTAGALGNFGQADWQRPFMANQYLANTVNPAWGSQGTTNNAFSQNTASNGTTNNTVNSTVAGPNAALAGIGGGMAGLGLWQNIFNTKA